MANKAQAKKLAVAAIIIGTGLLIIGIVMLISSKKVVTGTITSVSSEIIEVQKDDGTTEVFVNKAEDVSVEHLQEHSISEEPVKVKWENQNGQKTVISVEDK